MPDSAHQLPLPRVVVIGCGSIGERHINNLLALGVQDVLAHDVRPDQRHKVQTRFGITTVEQLEDVWALAPNAALIAVPTSCHVPMALEAAQHGCHLFIEKPLSDRVDEELSRLLAVVEERQLTTLVGCNLRFHPGLLRLKTLLEARAIGRVVAARVEFGQYLPDWHPWEDYRLGYSARQELGGGVILDAIHEIDYIRWLLGEAEAVSSFSGRLSHLQITTEDTAALMLRFANQAIVELHLDYVQRAYSRTCQLIGDEGTLRWDYLAGEVRLYTATTRTWQVFRNPQDWEPNQMYLDEMRHFLDCLSRTAVPCLNIRDARRVLEIALAAKTAARDGTVVTLPVPGSRKRDKVVAIVQARIASRRFPGKVLADIAGQPMLWHVVNRLRAARTVDEVVVATSTESADDAIVAFCRQEHVACFRGSEADVLDRFYQAATHHGAGVIVRITADCPLIDPHIVDKVVQAYLEQPCDYAANIVHNSYPDGLDTEVFSFSALERAWREAQRATEREHVTPYLSKSGRFRVCHVENDVDASARHLRWTVDEPEDLECVRAIYSQLSNGQAVFGMREVLRLLKECPALSDMNRSMIRNEGYYHSLANDAALPGRPLVLTQSRALKVRAEKVIPSCTQTFSKGPTQYVQGVAPVFLLRGQGSHVWDVDGNEFIDYPMALGPMILGYNDPAVTEAVMRQMQAGTVFSLPHPLEVEVAERLTQMIPCAEMVRFGKNGSDVTSAAVRVARAYTGRDLIACCGYHGWQDWYIGTTTRNKGIPKAVQDLTIPFEYNKLESLERIFTEHRGRIAAVIMEPVGLVLPQDGFLERVRELTQREGTLLVFDEVLTGFRVALGGAQEYFGVTPDLACLGKAMANGYPLAAIVGRRQVMELFDEVFFSFTFGGEALSLAAAAATLEVLSRHQVTADIWEKGKRLQDGYNVLAEDFRLRQVTACVGMPCRSVITFTDSIGQESLLYKSLFQQECLKRGVLFSGAQNPSYSHTDADIDRTLLVFRSAMEILAEAIKEDAVASRLEGPPVQPVFRRP